MLRVPVFPEQFHAGLAAIQEHGGEGPLLAVSVFFEHVGEPGGFDHGLVRVDRVGGALPCPGLGEFRPASFDGHGRCHVLEPVVGEPFPHARMFGLVDQVPEQSGDVVEFSSHVAGQVFVRGQRHPGVRIHNDEVAEFFNGFDVVPGVEQSSDEVEIHMSHTVEADGHRVDGFIHVFGHRRHRRDDPLGKHVSFGFEPVGADLLQTVELVEARIGVVRVEHAQVLFGIEPAVGCDEPVVLPIEVPDALVHGGVGGVRVSFDGEQAFRPVA